MKNHVVVLNWTDSAVDLLRTIHPTYDQKAHDRSKHHDVVVVSPVPVEFPHEPCFGNTYLILGNPFDTGILEKAGVGSSRTIIILADRIAPDPDNQTLMLALHVNRYLEEQDQLTMLHHDWDNDSGAGAPLGDSRIVRIVAEVLDAGNAATFSRSQLTGIHEVVCEDDLGLRILAQATESAGVSRVLGDLLDRSSDTSEIYQVQVPNRLIGNKFQSMRGIYDLVYGEFKRECGEVSIPVLIGLTRWIKGKPVFLVNPLNSYFRKEGAISDFRKGDCLLVVCKGNQNADNFFNEETCVKQQDNDG